jgi:hypothetical protein
MKHLHARWSIKALVLVMIVCGALPVSAQNPHPIAAVSLDREVARFQHQLAKSGYVWQSGAEGLLDANKRYCQGTLFSGMFANPQSPYIVSQLPEVPGQAPGTLSPLTWRLRQDEAVVLIGVTPPPVAYFSFELWMIKGSLANGPALFLSVGDPINIKTIRTTGPIPFDRPFALVLTGNRRTQTEVNRMLAASGLGGVTNNLTIPPAMFRLGLDQGSDEFLLPARTAVPEPGFVDALDEYRAHTPVQVFRVRPKGNSADETQPVYPPDPLRVPKLRVSGTGTTELDLNPTLQLLRQRIIDAYPDYEAQDVPLKRGFEEGWPGLQFNLVTDPPIEGTAGATNDCNYLTSADFELPDGSFVVAYGPNHVVTGKATYTSASLYVDAEAAVHLATKEHAELWGSARDFIGDQPNADKFYAWAFSRAGGSGPAGPHVTTLDPTTTDYCSSKYGTTRPVDLETIKLVTRIYMEPATRVRPALSELLLDRLLLFTPK